MDRIVFARTTNEAEGSMPECNVDLGLYRPDREYRTGDVVHGWVRVNVSQNVICHGLNLTAFWESDGKGNRSRKNYFQTTLFNGRWKTGETYEYQFEFSIPDYPLTYHGENLSIDHHIGVRAEIPWPVDSFCYQDIFVRPGIPVTSLPNDPLPMIEESKAYTFLRTLFGIIFIAAGILLSMKTIGLSIILGLIGGWYLYRAYGLRWAKKRLGDPIIEIDPVNVVAAQETRLSLIINPSSRLRNALIEAEVSGEEFVVSKKRREQYKLQHVIHRQTVEMPSPVDLESSQLQRINGMFTVPDTRAYTIDLPENQVRWQVAISIRVPLLPVIKLVQPFRLVPPALAGDEKTVLEDKTVG